MKLYLILHAFYCLYYLLIYVFLIGLITCYIRTLLLGLLPIAPVVGYCLMDRVTTSNCGGVYRLEKNVF